MAEMYTYQPIFQYGAVGDSLNGFRDSEIAQQSAKELLNFYITEMGTLKVAKQYKERPLLTDARADETIIEKLNTKYDFFIIITQHRIITYKKETLVKIDQIDGFNLDETCNINIVNNLLFIKEKQDVSVLTFSETGDLGTTNYFDIVQLPFQQKQDVAFDVYQCFSIDGKVRPELMTTFTKDAELKIDENGIVYLKNSNLKIDRIYEQYKSVITTDQINGATNGLVFIVFRNFQASSGDISYHLGNTKISFTDRTKDDKYGSYYYTKASPKCYGKLIYGVLENFLKDKNKVMDIVEFQSRLVIATNEKIYFSKILDYENFVPSLEADAPFFIKPSIIDGNQPNIKKMVVGNGLYIVCEEGIIVGGYGSTINGINMSNIHIAGNSKPSHLTTLIEDIFYYVDTSGLLRAIIPNFESGIIRFANVIVEKYNYEKLEILRISRGSINEDNVLFVTLKGKDFFRIYNEVEKGLFRKFDISFNNIKSIIGYNYDIINGTNYYELTDKNVLNSKLVLNVPFIKNSKGIFLNDFSSTYRRIVTNVYSGDKNAIKGVSINNYPIQNLGDELKGDYSIYDFNGTLPVIDLTINIKTKETNNTIELRGINSLVCLGN